MFNRWNKPRVAHEATSSADEMKAIEAFDFLKRLKAEHTEYADDADKLLALLKRLGTHLAR
jgi:hypothetical protein